MSDRRTPWMKFYPADWRADTKLRACSPTARGVWLDLIGLMHESDRYGYLLLNGVAPTNALLSGLINVHHQTLKAALKELGKQGVYSVDDGGVIYSRRMVRDFEKAQRDQENGGRGGNPNIRKGVNPPVKGEDKAQKPEARSQIRTHTPDGVCATPAPGDLFASPSKKKSPARRIGVPLDLAMSEPMRAFAADRGLLNGRAEAAFEHFKNHHAAKGTTFANVEAGWRTWVMNEIKFNQPARSAPSAAKPSMASVIDRMEAEGKLP